MAASKKSVATSVSAWLQAIPEDRRDAVRAVRDVVVKNLPRGYAESLIRGSILTWSVPLEVYPDTYNGQPMWYAALVNQKSYVSLHMVMAYMNPPLTKKLQDGFKAAGKKLDMGKGCVHFTSADDLALDVIGDVVASVPMDRYVAIAKAAREGRKGGKAKR